MNTHYLNQNSFSNKKSSSSTEKDEFWNDVSKYFIFWYYWKIFSISEKENMIKKRSDNIFDIIGNFNTPDFLIQNDTIQKSNKSKSNSFDKDKNKENNYLTCIT